MRNLRDGVLSEDVGHPAFSPDKDLVDELMSTCNKSANRLTVGNIVGSLLVVTRALLFSRQSSGKEITRGQIHDVCLMTAQYLSRPPKRDSGLGLRQ